MSPLHAGFAREEITPPIGLLMGGYGDRKGTAQGVHDPLWGQILLLDDGQTQAGLIILDLIAVDAAFVDDLRREIEVKIGLPGGNFLIAATHTHAGPAGMRMGQTDLDQSTRYINIRIDTRDKLLDLIRQAKADLQPAQLSAAVVQAPRLLANRLDPLGPMDDSLSVIKLQAQNDDLLGILVGYTGHPTLLSQDNLLYSSDYPHYLRQELQINLGESIPILFVNGAAGDVSSRYTRQASNFDEANRVGTTLGRAAYRAIRQSQPCSVERLKVLSREVMMPMRQLPTLEEARQRLTQAESKLKRSQEQGMHGPELRQVVTEYYGSRSALKHVEHGAPPNIKARLQAIVLGNTALLSLPGELFVTLGQRIKSSSPYDLTLLVGYANDYIGYIPSQQAYEEQGYEVRKTLLAPGAGEYLADAAVKLLKDIQVAS
jgi:neutral ceramidase